MCVSRSERFDLRSMLYHWKLCRYLNVSVMKRNGVNKIEKEIPPVWTPTDFYQLLRPGLEKMQISQEEVYISNKFPTMSYVFLYVKSHNFPPHGQIFREGASQIPHFFQPWLRLSQNRRQMRTNTKECQITNVTTPLPQLDQSCVFLAHSA